MKNNSITMRRFIIAIPARLESSRLPNKVLADIDGKPMLLRVLEQCKKAVDKSKIVLCTDNKYLTDLAKNIWGFNVIVTSKDCTSGSERIASVTDELIRNIWSKEEINRMNLEDIYKNSLIINVQGDQPFLDPDIIKKMINNFELSEYISDVITPIYKINAKNIHNTAIVKTLISNKENVIYFSRSPLPHVRGIPEKEWHKYSDYWGHVGMYGYRSDILKKWFKLPDSKLEKIEKLEQLKLIEAGYRIDTFKIEGDSLSIDTPEQLEEARSYAEKLLKDV